MPHVVAYTITRAGQVATTYQATKFCAPSCPIMSVIATKVITVGGYRYVRRDLP